MLGVGELIAAILVLTAAILFYWTGRRERRLLAKIPSTPGWPVIGSLPTLVTVPLEDTLELARSWAEKLGPIYLLNVAGVSEIFITGPDEIQTVLSNKDHLDKSVTYSFLQPWIGTGLLTSSGDKSRSRRKMLTPAFHYNTLKGFMPVFNANSTILVAKLRQHTEEYVEINDYVTLYTLDVICETMMGTAINAQVGGGTGYIRAVARMCTLVAHRLRTPWLYPDIIFQLSPSGREQKRVVQVLKDFTDKVIRKKRLEHQNVQQNDEDDTRTSSILDLLLEISEQTGKLTDDDIREEINTFVFAGHDTTAVTISWALFVLGAHQDIQDKVVAELSDIFGSDQREPTPADLQNMTYLDMVIKESMRLFPTIGLFARHLTSDFKIGEYTIPSGCNIYIFSYIVHRNPDIYPDPERFDPERFSPEQVSGRHPYAYIPFSVGPRNCIGQKFARLEMKSALSSILRNFKLESLDYESAKMMPEIVFGSKDPLKIKFSTRVL